MRLFVSLAAVAAAALVAGACSKPAASGGAAGAAGAPGAAPAAASGPDVAITKADLPHLKAGQWQTVETSPGQPPHTSTHCDDGKPFDPSTMAGQCQSVTLKRTALGAIVFDFKCGNDRMSVASHMVASGDFSSAVSADLSATTTVAGHAPETMSSHMELKYLGACKPGDDNN